MLQACHESFQKRGVPVYEFPDEMAAWKKRAEWLIRDFSTNAKSTKEGLRDLVEFANGDSRGSKVVHYCLIGGERPCCESSEESLCKFLSHAVQILTRGYPTPLLYRMKHYSGASSFIRFGCNFFQMLPRVLQELDSSTPNNDIVSLADALMSETGFVDPDVDFQRALQDQLDVDQAFASQNKVRRQLVVQEINKPQFSQGAIVIDVMIQPIEWAVNWMLSHTACLYELRSLGRGHEKERELRQKTSQRFFHVMSGALGDALVSKYLLFLEEGGLKEAIQMGLEPHPEMLNRIFQLTTMCLSDLERRFKHSFLSPPFSLFKLLTLDHAEFVHEWGGLQDRYHQCKNCIDPDFAGVILQHFSGDIRHMPVLEQQKIRGEIVELLQDLAEWCPLTSDAVELKNGITQWIISRRGSQHAKAPRASSENTLIQSLVRQHSWSLGAASQAALPPKKVSAGILKMSGVSSNKDWLGFWDRIHSIHCSFILVW